MIENHTSTICIFGGQAGGGERIAPMGKVSNVNSLETTRTQKSFNFSIQIDVENISCWVQVGWQFIISRQLTFFICSRVAVASKFSRAHSSGRKFFNLDANCELESNSSELSFVKWGNLALFLGRKPLITGSRDDVFGSKGEWIWIRRFSSRPHPSFRLFFFTHKSPAH